MPDPTSDPTGQTRPFTASGRNGVGVLLSHGFTGSPASMRPWGELLADHGYAVSVPLLPGHATTWRDLNRFGWSDWLGALESAFDDLRTEVDTVVLGGLSMGGGLALELAARRAHDVAGLMLVNPAVSSADRRLLALPVLKRLVGAIPGISGDIKKPGATEYAYDKTPLAALHSLTQGWRQVRADLPKVTAPILLFRSRVDHVVDDGSIRDVEAGVSSREVEKVVLEDSFHVATIDNDAPVIFEKSLDFLARVTAAG